MSEPDKSVHGGGLSLLETGVVLMLVMLVCIGVAQHWKQSTDNLEYSATATHLNTLNTAAVDYIHDNYAAVSQAVSAGKPYYISGQQLRDAGYLTTGFALTNNSHQDYQVAVALNPKFSNKLVAFVLTQNGARIPYDGLRTITAYAGGMAGYVNTANVAEGAFGNWKVMLSDYGLTATPGHLATMISSDQLGNSASAGDRLYRYAVDGHPDLNQMQTAIDMNKNNIDNAATISSADITASDTVSTRILNATGDITAGGTVRADGRLSTGDVLQLDKVNVAGTACDTTGLMSRDAQGAPLSCINGIWTSPGNGWKMPQPQTISCTIKHNNYADFFEAKVDSTGNFWTHFGGGHGAPDSGWVRGGYSWPTQTWPIIANVSVSGLLAQEPLAQCEDVPHSGEHCGDTIPHYCFTAWQY